MRWLFWLICAILPLSAVEYAPWFERVLYFEGRINSSYEGGKRSDLVRNEASLRVTPWNDLRVEAEADFFRSDRFSYGLESLQLSGQYRFLNESYGDPFFLSSALTFILPTTRAKREYALFYPGAMEYEFHLVAGKEWALESTWTDRVYCDGAYGIAHQRSPWWRTRWQYDRNLFECGLGSLFIKTVAGGGVRFLEYGGTYTYFFDYGSMNLTLAHRPIAHHFPHASIVTLEVLMPIAF